MSISNLSYPQVHMYFQKKTSHIKVIFSYMLFDAFLQQIENSE